MELELEQERTLGYDLAAEKFVHQEETMESIVPDACPDILRIADVCGCPMIMAQKAKDEMAVISGSVRTTILYEPDGESGLCKMRVDLPYTCQVPVSGLTDRGEVVASVHLHNSDARILNPRKVLLRVNLSIRICAYQPFEQNVCCGARSDREIGLCQKKTDVQECCICEVAEKAFELETQLRLKGGQEEETQVLSLLAGPVCSDSKLIGSKLIFKGTAALTLLTQDNNDRLSMVREEVPFSQIMEVKGDENNCIGDLTLSLQSLEWSTDTDDSGLISVSVGLLAQVTVRQNKQLTVLEDLYSTRFFTECQSEPVFSRYVGEENTVPQPVRELIEATPAIHTLIDSQINFEEITQDRQEHDLQLSVNAVLNLIYLDQDLHLHRVAQEFPISCRIDCLAEDQCECRCICPESIYAAPSAGGAEVRFNVEYRYRMIHVQKIQAVSLAQVGDERGTGKQERPSVVLRRAIKGETLWDIAKCYGTTETEIIAANGLDDAVPSSGTMLLIPGIR